MKISCQGKNRAMYNHSLFDGTINFNREYALKNEAGFSYDPSENEVSVRFHTGHITLGGEYSCEIRQSMDEMLDTIPNLFMDRHHRSAAQSHVAALKTLLAAEYGAPEAA